MFLKISNFTNYTKWCNEIKQEIANRWRLNHIIAAPPENKDPQWKQNDAQVMSWILCTLDTTIINGVIDHTASAHELWTWISTFLGPVTDERGSEKREENWSESENSHSGEVMSSKTKKSPPKLRWVTRTVARLRSPFLIKKTDKQAIQI